MAAGPSVDSVVAKVVEAYQRSDCISFCYGQGSVLTGITSDSDIDIVMIWTDSIPPPSERPVRALSDPSLAPVQFDGAFGGLDNLRVDSWPVDVAHYTKHEFDRWIQAVHSGDGWQDQAWPLPLFAVSGFAYGRILTDPSGAARSARVQVGSFPSALLDNARLQLHQAWPDARTDLEGCVRRSDGWLFHELAGDLLRTTYITWFAAHHRYCPFLKRTAAWARRFELDPELLEIEQHMWRTGPLDERLALIAALVEGVLRIANHES